MVRAAAGEAPMPGSVLIIEDEQVIRDMLSEILEECGLAVTAAAELGSARALMLADGDEFDFVVLNSTLPDGDGLSFCAELRAGRFDRPIIVVGGARESQVRAAAVGASAWVQKPFTISALLEQIEAALIADCESALGAVGQPRFRPTPLC